VFDADTWERLTDLNSKPITDIAVGLDAPPGRDFATVALAGRRADGLLHVEWYQTAEGVTWLPAWVAARLSKSVRAVVVDSRSPLVELGWTDAKVRLTQAGFRDLASGCGALVDAVADGDLRHRGRSSCPGVCSRRDGGPCSVGRGSRGTGRLRGRRLSSRVAGGVGCGRQTPAPAPCRHGRGACRGVLRLSPGKGASRRRCRTTPGRSATRTGGLASDRDANLGPTTFEEPCRSLQGEPARAVGLPNPRTSCTTRRSGSTSIALPKSDPGDLFHKTELPKVGDVRELEPSRVWRSKGPFGVRSPVRASSLRVRLPPATTTQSGAPGWPVSRTVRRRGWAAATIANRPRPHPRQGRLRWSGAVGSTCEHPSRVDLRLA
jgi:hypothetical protein